MLKRETRSESFESQTVPLENAAPGKANKRPMPALVAVSHALFAAIPLNGEKMTQFWAFNHFRQQQRQGCETPAHAGFI